MKSNLLPAFLASTLSTVALAAEPTVQPATLEEVNNVCEVRSGVSATDLNKATGEFNRAMKGAANIGGREEKEADEISKIMWMSKIDALFAQAEDTVSSIRTITGKSVDSIKKNELQMKLGELQRQMLALNSDNFDSSFDLNVGGNALRKRDLALAFDGFRGNGVDCDANVQAYVFQNWAFPATPHEAKSSMTKNSNAKPVGRTQAPKPSDTKTLTTLLELADTLEQDLQSAKSAWEERKARFDGGKNATRK